MGESRLARGVPRRRWPLVGSAVVVAVGAMVAATREHERLTDEPQPITFVPAESVDYPAVSFRPTRVSTVEGREVAAAAAPLTASLGLDRPERTTEGRDTPEGAEPDTEPGERPGGGPDSEGGTAAGRLGRLTLRSVGAERPGVYAGHRGRAPCRPRSVLGEIAADPKLAEMFTEAQNSDISLAWRSPPLDTDELDVWSGDLTPVHLAVPTRVALHQIDRDGHLHKTEAVLAAGTAVGVDLYGVPRVRCRGGEPLTAPTQLNPLVEWISPSEEMPPPWAVVVQRTAIPAEEFVLADASGGSPFRRPVGTYGERDQD